MRILKWAILPVLAALALWSGMLATDYVRVIKLYEKPLFCMASREAEKTGDSGYQGLGYGFLIQGNFRAGENETHSVEFYLLGMKIRRFTAVPRSS